MRISDWSSDVCSSDLETVGRGDQALLFLNRKGYAPLTLCRTCGHRIECPNCTAWMVEHRLLCRLQCHQCGHSMPVPDACPECQSEGTLVACGPGVERIADEIARSEEHTSELQSLMRISYAVFCLKKKTEQTTKAQH